MRKLPIPALLLLVAACNRTDKPTADTAGGDAPSGEKPKFAVGDPAPPLRATKWLKGEPVAAFEPGKAYVVDFWATWCGPCIMSMPHLSDLQTEYRDKGLTVVAFTTEDQRNKLEQVEQFVQKRAGKFAFGVAFAADQATYDAYMTAAGQNGIPCSFVVGKDGKLAFIGHPTELDDVLPKVVAGTWKGKADLDAIARMNKKLEDILEAPNAAARAAAGKAGDAPGDQKVRAMMAAAEEAAGAAVGPLAAFEAKYPDRVKRPDYLSQKAILLLRGKKTDEARAATERLIAHTAATKNPEGATDAFQMWSSPGLNPDKKHPDLIRKAADAVAAAAAGDPIRLFRAAQGYKAAGDAAKAKDFGQKAIAAAGDDADMKQGLTEAVKQLTEEKPADKKDKK